MRFTILFTAIIFVSGTHSWAQCSNDDYVRVLPDEFKTVLIDDDRGTYEIQVDVLAPSSRIDRSNRPDRNNGALESWVVISDRANNTLYNDKELTTQSGQALDLGDKLYVLCEQETALEVIQLKGPPNSDLSYSDKDQGFLKRGWISKENLLLWTRPLVSQKTRFEVKAFLVNTSQEVVKSISAGDLKEDFVELYNGPNSIVQIEEKQLYEVLFVYNFIDNGNTQRFLVGSEPTLEGAEYDLFWVNRFRLKTWNTRVALEWNYDEAACKERKESNVQSGIFFINPEKAEAHRDGNYTNAMFNDKEYTSAIDPCSSNKMEEALSPSSGNRRYFGNVMRYPYFGDQGDERNIIQCGATVKMGYKSELGGFAELEDESWRDIENKMEQLIQSGPNVNCMLVFHGHQDMRDRREELKMVIDQFAALNEHEKYNGKVKVGVVIYKGKNNRDRIYSRDAGSSKAHFEDLKTWIEDPSKYRSEGSADCKGLMKYGLKTAIEKGFQKNETNITILFGTCGDAHIAPPTTYDESYVENTDLKDLLYEYKVNVLAIQREVNEQKARESSQFYRELDRIFTDVTNQIDNDYTSLVQDVSGDENWQLTQHTWTTKENISKQYDYQLLKDSHLSMGIVFASDVEGASLNDQVFESHVSNFITEVSERKARILDMLSDVIFDGSDIAQRSGQAGGELDKFLSQHLSVAEIKVAKSKKVHLLKEGYAAMKISGNTHNTYKYVLFMKRDDLTNLIDKMSEIVQTGGASQDQREALVDAWYEYAGAILNEDAALLRQQYPGDKSNTLQGILNHGIKDLGQSTEASIFSKYSADLILEEGGRVPSSMIRTYMDDITKNMDELKKLLRNEEMEYRTAKHVFYWVDIELLP